MNDFQIRQSFHKKKLHHHHDDDDTLVIDELGLHHGRCRADIAVINGHLVGYEIKSDQDTLNRLEKQVESYSSVFDKAYIIVGGRYAQSIQDHIPDWWGIIISSQGSRGSISFRTLRKAVNNPSIDLFSVAQLLWRCEAAEILSHKKVAMKILRKPRSFLYRYLVDLLQSSELKKNVREYLKKRTNWRCHQSLLSNGG